MNLGGLETILAFIIVLGLAVLLHEFGHFAAAKAMGVRVLEFAFGFPPKLFTLFERNGTQYSVCALPIGGYVKLAGQEPGEEAGEDGFNSKPVWKRILIIFAGPFMNFVLAAIIFIGMGLTGGVPVGEPNASISGVMSGQPAESAGFKPGDQIVAIDGRPVNMDAMLETVRGSANKPMTITVKRDQQNVDLHVTPLPKSGADAKQPVGQIGVELQPIPNLQRVGAIKAVGYGAATTWEWTYNTVCGIGKMFTDREARKQVGGPVVIARLAGHAFREGMMTFLTFLAAISINLGVLNLLPLLVLDGGQIAIFALEGIRGRKLQQSLQVAIQVVGMALLLLLMAVLTVHDISNWINGKLF
ncbi:MAG TPA: RIP metalloprotease RseP [Armatimonadota bacterium]|nr:RIP metalloprotease RseP [Armatimonadota bacterium]